ncbi:MAG: RagB/SusD family nutrient uptake outer membrane protein [Cyclobacteriaceae bacterium]
MKIYNKWQTLTATLLLFLTVGCSDFLDEESIANQTADNYFNTQQGFEDLTLSIYPLWRDITQQRTLVLRGTDLFSAGGWDNANTDGALEDTFGPGFGASFAPVQLLWDLLYVEVNRANTVITRSETVVGMDASDVAIRVAEAKVMRAMSMFYLVQQFGDVPMPLEETSTSNKEVIRVPSAEVYTQIIADLTEAEGVLPVQSATEWGRATKGMAQFLLARVYLTRGWNFNNSLGGSAADFGQALTYADRVIADYPLAANYSDLFAQRNENPLLETLGPADQDARNDEIIFAVQYSEDVLTNGGYENNPEALIGNNAHSIFGNGPDNTPGAASRTSQYNRHQGRFHVTPSLYRWYDPNIDTRYDHNFVERIYAINDAVDFIPADGVAPFTINSGDVTVEFRAWDNPASGAERGLDIPGGTMPYAVINTDEYGRIAESNYHGANFAPMMWKFWEPNIEYGDGNGAFDLAMFRSAEAYLIAAEAIVKGATGGDLGTADVYYNRVVDRSLGANAGSDPMQAADPADVSSLVKVSYRATPGNIDIDMILDERARELMAEGMRWYDLKRTEKWIERAMEHNPWTASANALNENHLLRPIPLGELDLASNDLSQNAGY